VINHFKVTDVTNIFLESLHVREFNVDIILIYGQRVNQFNIEGKVLVILLCVSMKKIQYYL
jgi:hypothetical protein